MLWPCCSHQAFLLWAEVPLRTRINLWNPGNRSEPLNFWQGAPGKWSLVIHGKWLTLPDWNGWTWTIPEIGSLSGSRGLKGWGGDVRFKDVLIWYAARSWYDMTWHDTTWHDMYDMISYEMIWCLKGRMPVFSRQQTWQTNARTSLSWDQIPGPQANSMNLIKFVISNQYHLPEVPNSTSWVPQDSCSRPKALVSATKIDFIQAIEANESSARRRVAGSFLRH